MQLQTCVPCQSEPTEESVAFCCPGSACAKASEGAGSPACGCRALQLQPSNAVPRPADASGEESVGAWFLWQYLAAFVAVLLLLLALVLFQ